MGIKILSLMVLENETFYFTTIIVTLIGSIVAFYNKRLLPSASIHHTKCEVIMTSSGSSECCRVSDEYR